MKRIRKPVGYTIRADVADHIDELSRTSRRTKSSIIESMLYKLSAEELRTRDMATGIAEDEGSGE